MLQEQVQALHVGDEVVHQSGVTRKVVAIKRGRHILLKPKLRGGGGTAHINLPQFAATHSMPVRIKADPVFDRVFRKGDPVPMPDLALVGQKIAEFHKDGLIPQCLPRVEAYFMLLEAQFEEAANASRD